MAGTKLTTTLWIGFGAASLALAAPCAASAADAAGNFAVRGVGGQTCGQFVELVGATDPQTKRDAVLVYESWLSGYLSRTNRGTPDTFDASPIVNSRDMLTLLLRQCQRQPEALVETMAAGVIDALLPAGLSTQSELITVSDGERSRSYRQATVVRVQERLIELGHFQGSADGRFGPSSGVALQKFQESAGLEQTGFLDLDTLIRLLLG